jgi:hypothetical protein
MEEEDKARLLEGMEGIIPYGVMELLKANEFILWCSTCVHSIYETSVRNRITEKVARDATNEHIHAYTEQKHRVTAWAKDVKERRPN